MTPTETRIACAEAMGWKWVKYSISSTKKNHNKYWFGSPERTKAYLPSFVFSRLPEGEEHEGTFGGKESIPDYPTDANAALTLLEEIAKTEWGVFVRRLTEYEGIPAFWRVIINSIVVESPSFPLAVCEAFLRARGLWKE